MALPTAASIIQELSLLPHPEGGYYREVFRSPLAVVSEDHEGPRAASTLIYYLLTSGDFSALHRVRSDESWHHYLGDALELYTWHDAGPQLHLLGSQIAEGQRPLHVVQAGCFQAARVAPGPYGFALCGCGVAPGFQFSDFEMPSQKQMLTRYPEHESLVLELTRSPGQASAISSRGAS